MSCIEQITQELHARGFRVTPQRLAILQILHIGGHLSPSEVYMRARQILPGITEATIYRTLEFLAENGAIFRAHPENGRLAYEIAAHNHHHVVCHICRQEIEIGHKLLETMYEQIEKASGFQLDTSHLTFFGICPVCNQNNVKNVNCLPKNKSAQRVSPNFPTTVTKGD